MPRLIREGELDKAEDAARELLRCYPDQVDGLHRLAEVYKAMSDIAEAREYFEKTLNFMKTHEGFDEGSYAWVVDELSELSG